VKQARGELSHLVPNSGFIVPAATKVALTLTRSQSANAQ
jgi:hypothetical protein